MSTPACPQGRSRLLENKCVILATYDKTQPFPEVA
uniref:Uncharacterized protein n=1 Tax=Anguilla anguilla TaxID=7936 RepID=A0A0E9UQW0_ANGAN